MVEGFIGCIYGNHPVFLTSTLDSFVISVVYTYEGNDQGKSEKFNPLTLLVLIAYHRAQH